MPTKRILSLGQCSADHGSISRLIRNKFQAEVIAAATPEEALTELRTDPVDLVLVNRVLDWSGESGLEFIQQLKADPTLGQIPVMLVSNHDDAQQEAVAAGALPGFGKSGLGHPETDARLRVILEGAQSQGEG